jgi:outer membrane lipoprotein-sorting protein
MGGAMKKAFARGVLIALFCGLHLIPVSAQDKQSPQIEEAKKILEKSVQAMGGRERLLSIKDTVVSSQLKIISLNITVTRTTYVKGDKIRLETKTMGTTTVMAFNGKTGWIMTPKTISAVDLPQPLLDELKRAAMSNEAMLYPEKFGLTVTLEGRKSIEGKEYIVLVQTGKDGNTSTVYLDPDSYLTYKTVSMALTDSLQKAETEIILSDYRDVEGTKVPFSMKIVQNGKDYAAISISEYKYNTHPQDSLFEKPE